MSDVLCHHRRRDPLLRRRSLDIRRWALARGRGIDPDALTMVLRVIDDDVEHGHLPADVWTADRVLEFIWARAWSWCEVEGITLPPSAPAALLAVLDHLHESGELAAASDPIQILRAQLGANAQLEATPDAHAPLATVAVLPRRVPVPT
ncbi:MAG: hypothetical protein GY929_04390 [Actinomycetia bacterium]|nr:hypothetical protein [Actinomycetes bacterium]